MAQALMAADAAAGLQPPGTAVQDPLLAALALLAARLERPVHVTALRSGFALDAQGRVPTSALPDVARRHGLAAAWTRTPPSQLPAYVLPSLVPCLDGRCFVLLGYEGDAAQRQARVLSPETGLQEQRMDAAELDALCGGQVLVVKASVQQGEQVLTPLRGKALGWFWGTLWRF